MIDLSRVFQPSYWFQLYPSQISASTEKFLLAFFLVVLAAGVFFRFTAKNKTLDRFKIRAAHRATGLCLTMGSVGLLFLFFTYEQVRLFGSRFWYLFWLLGVAVWAGSILYDYLKVAPRERLVEDVRKQKEKYLPRKKR